MRKIGETRFDVEAKGKEVMREGEPLLWLAFEGDGVRLDVHLTKEERQIVTTITA